MLQFKLPLFLISILLPMSVLAQSLKSVRINEIQVLNSEGFRDGYGQPSGWIELHNTGHGKVNLAGCILKVKGKEYIIPRGDPNMVIPTQGYLVFFADGTPNKGPFHTNFTLDDTDFIGFYDADKNLIDGFQFDPADMVDGVSYGWFEDRDGEERLRNLPATTPGSSNNTLDKIHRSEAFRQADPTGVVLTITGTAVISLVMTLLFFVFKYMGQYYIKAAVKKQEAVKAAAGNADEKKAGAITNEELAAIAMALHKHLGIMQQHEEMVLTINKVSKTYSPWSSKIYGLRETPLKRHR